MILVLTTVPDDRAEALSRALVTERLAACASAVPGVRSTYFWQGKLEVSPETLVLLKTRDDLAQALAARIRELHPYEVPEILILPVRDGNPAYSDWVAKETAQPAHPSSSNPSPPSTPGSSSESKPK